MKKSVVVRWMLLLLFECFISIQLYAGKNFLLNSRMEPSIVAALNYIDNIGSIDASESWPNINAGLFIKNLKRNIEHPELIYQGMHTNFCGYAALTFLLVKENPLLYANSLIGLFKRGSVKYGKKYLKPEEDVRFYAGTLHDKGPLDSLHADQLWFLTLADQFKGYVNIFDHHFNAGDENKLWAGVNYSKFNRMGRKLMGHKVEAIGTDIYKPTLDDMPCYLQQQLQKGSVVLMTNSRIKDRPTKAWIKLMLPIHFIVLQHIEEIGDAVHIEFWDYGGFKSKKIPTKTFYKTVNGISTILPQENLTAQR